MDYPELGPVLERILEVVPAQQIILFGSRAKAAPTATTTWWWCRLNCPSVGWRNPSTRLCVLVVAHPADLERYHAAWMTIYPEVLQSGRVLYAA